MSPTTPVDLVRGEDGLLRCWWAGDTRELERYHDTEWGRSGRDERDLFERLCLEAFQAGLSWRIVLERREALRSAFSGFEPTDVGRFTTTDIEHLMEDRRLIRNRAKITAVVENARLLGRLHDRGVRLQALTDDAVARVPLGERDAPPRARTDVPASTATSIHLARELRRLGWRFVGPTTAYAYLQAAGWVDDHLMGCHARGPDS